MVKLFTITFICLITIFFLGRLTAQPRSLDDLVEFRADGIYARETFKMTLPYWPQYVIQKGYKICEIIEEQATKGD